MKAYITIIVLSVAILTGCVSQPARVDIDKGYLTEIDDTVPTKYRIHACEGPIALRKYIDEPSGEAIFGEYRHPMDLTAGQIFYFYPDGAFRIVEWIDIAPSFLIATGTWKQTGNLIEVCIKQEYAGWGPGMKGLTETHGKLDRWYLFVTQNDELIGDTILVSETTLMKGNSADWDYLERDVYYRDWQKLCGDARVFGRPRYRVIFDIGKDFWATGTYEYYYKKISQWPFEKQVPLVVTGHDDDFQWVVVDYQMNAGNSEQALSSALRDH